MNYWHMQLEPDEELGIEKIKEILNKNLIGMGDWEEKKDGNPQQTSFQKRMNIGDIVLIKSGKTVIGLVRVTSNYFETEPYRDDVWFKRRRGIEILEILDKPKYDFPQPLATLTIASDTKSSTYIYILIIGIKDLNKKIN